ncbi:coronin, putative [Entamoeba invadens IP1]|uniref:Coronin n=1 Tax=Entamoeba invadens IP1 TaxID=370355 RepID=A0A0A1UAI2_ENTIV|nr:coronin, putative [Entamoeba invadens IP1]ELP92063.1 coronin, putative [Entamoeba invadens IP1]|eukprot:XP_004258834.1 coronin, putative [Entamoeba invadens IP1]
MLFLATNWKCEETRKRHKFMFKTSKYKHIQCQNYKVEEWYPDVKTSNGGPEVTMMVATSTYLALNWQSAGAGSIGCIPLTERGKRKAEPTFCKGHTAEIVDMISCPFNDNLIFSCSGDGTIKGWELPFPTAMSKTISPCCSLEGHRRKVDVIAHNYGAPVIASASSDGYVKLWDYVKQSEVKSIENKDTVFSMDWQYDGNVMILTGKDKKLKVVDFRAGSVVKTYAAHEGTKMSCARYVGKEEPFVFSVGFDRTQSRQMGVFDLRTDKAVCLKPFPGTSSVCKPIVDLDTSLMYISGRGDSLVKIYEFDAKNKMFISELATQNTGEALKGISLLPKRAVHVNQCEINTLLRLGNGKVSKAGSYIIRRASMKYQDDLYPDTLWVGESLSADDYLSGKDAKPKEVSLQCVFGDQKALWDAYESNEVKEAKKAAEEEKKRLAEEEQKKVEEAQRAEEEKNRIIHKAPQIIRSTHFRHINIKAFNKNTNIIDLKMNTTTSQSLVKCNKKWVGVPWTGVGKIALWPADKPGKMTNPIFCDNGGNVTDFMFDLFNDDKVYICGEDGKIRVFLAEAESAQKVQEINAHPRKIVSINANPFISNCVITVGAEPSIRMWDVANESLIKEITGFGEQIGNISFSSTGERMAVSCKDHKLYIVDLRKGEIETSIEVPQNGGKGFMCAWCGRKERVFTVGFSKSSQRMYSLVDVKEMKVMHTSPIDTESAVMTPIYDEDINVVFLIGRGSKTLHCFEVTDEDPYVFPLNISTFDDVVNGFDVSHKEEVDVKKSEVMRLTLLIGEPPSAVSKNSVIVPRVKLNFFQDDIFPDTRRKVPTYTPEEWIEGKVKDVEYISLQPEGMIKLSEAPSESERAKYSYEQERKRIEKEEEDKRNAAIFDRVLDSMNEKRDTFEYSDSPEWSDD